MGVIGSPYDAHLYVRFVRPGPRYVRLLHASHHAGHIENGTPSVSG
jgi:hypothetical protein